MNYIKRNVEAKITSILEKEGNILLLGPRQTGKTTSLRQIQSDLSITLIEPRTRLRYEKDPSILSDEIRALAETLEVKPLVIVDEIQKVPQLMDVIQELIDDNIAQFILTGSSARKLKHGKYINLLPGRVIPLNMYPLQINEIPVSELQIENLLLSGALPKIIGSKTNSDKDELLDAYVMLYLEEEIRLEALVRNVSNFARFLELAASESGYTINYSKLSQIVGVAHTTIAEYYQILEDCLIAERIEPLTKSKSRHKLSMSNKYVFFDLGLRRSAAREGRNLPLKTMGHLFEQFIGLELIKQASLSSERVKIYYWKDLDGPEVDWVISTPDQLIPIEVKFTDKPNLKDARHLITFLNEYEEAHKAYIICQVPRKMKLSDTVYAIPWQNCLELLPS